MREEKKLNDIKSKISECSIDIVVRRAQRRRAQVWRQNISVSTAFFIFLLPTLKYANIFDPVLGLKL